MSFIVCANGSVSENEAVPGSKDVTCAHCDAVCRIAPSGVKLVADNGLTIICDDCFENLVEPGDEIAAPNAEQLLEIIRSTPEVPQ